MTAAYPLDLRTVLSASKSRTQPASFRMNEPRRGYGYAQAIGTDTPVFWDVEFRFSRPDAVRFMLWFITVINRGLLEFTMPIRTEFGDIEHVCRFLPDGLGDCMEDGQSVTYTAQIMARSQIVPQGYSDAAHLIVALSDWNEWAEMLDIGLNREIPA